MHLLEDVTPADKLTLNVQLGEGWPVRELLNALSDVLIKQHVNVLVVVNPVELEHLHGVVAEPASGHLFGALHKEHDIVVLDPVTELSIEFLLIHRGLLLLGCEVGVRLLPIIMLMVVVVDVAGVELSH